MKFHHHSRLVFLTLALPTLALAAPKAVRPVANPFAALKASMLEDAKVTLSGEPAPNAKEIAVASKAFDDSVRYIEEKIRAQIVNVYGLPFKGMNLTPMPHACNGLSLCTISGTAGDFTFKAVMVLEEGKTMVMMHSRDGRSVLEFHSDGMDQGSEGAAASQ